MSSTTDIGRAGEFFAAYVLERHGVECHHVDRAGSDLWCQVNGSITTVQVKTASCPRCPGSRHKRLYYRFFAARPTAARWFALVALDRELLLLKHTSVIQKKYLSLDPEEFTPEAQEQTIEAFLKSC